MPRYTISFDDFLPFRRNHVRGLQTIMTLGLCAQNPNGVRMGEIAHLLNCTPQNVANIIDPLERHYLVERRPGKDRREILAFLTEQGQALVTETHLLLTIP